jgi:hypothetical protein
VVSAVLGHGDEDVTDRYIDVPTETQIAELNRAALLIDGEMTDNLVPIVRDVDRRVVLTA